MIIAQISDLHATVPGGTIYDGYRPEAAVAATLARLGGLVPRPDLVLITGDLTETGAPEEYASLRRVLAGCDLPMVAIPGNHDRRAAFLDGLAGTGVTVGAPPWLNLVIDLGGLRLIALDSLGPEGEDWGEICAGRLDWLAARLAEAPDRPTVIFMHHPPFDIGIDFMDAIACRGGAGLAALVARHPQVLRLSCGHVHRAVEVRFGGNSAGTCPSVASMVPLDLAPGAPPRLLPQAPGFQLHVWSEAGGLVTHTEYLADP